MVYFLIFSKNSGEKKADLYFEIYLSAQKSFLLIFHLYKIIFLWLKNFLLNCFLFFTSCHSIFTLFESHLLLEVLFRSSRKKRILFIPSFTLTFSPSLKRHDTPTTEIEITQHLHYFCDDVVFLFSFFVLNNFTDVSNNYCLFDVLEIIFTIFFICFLHYLQILMLINVHLEMDNLFYLTLFNVYLD